MMQELSTSHHQFKFLFDNNFDAVYVYDDNEDKIVDINESFKKMFCWNKTMQNIKRTDIVPEYQSDGISSIDHLLLYKQILKAEKKCRFNFLHRRFNNEIFETETTILINKDNKNMYTTIIKDLTDLKKKEAALARSITNLNGKNILLQRYIDSNVALENYAFMVSHDLQSPLKTVKAFLDLFNKSLNVQLNDDQDFFMDHINSSINHMETLIKSLLNYSLVSTNKTEHNDLDISLLIENVNLSLSAIINEKRASIEVQEMPSLIRGDQSRLRQLFQNLITNALKFVKKDTTPIIKIYYEDLPDYWKFYINDNGIDIDIEHQERIFNLFNKLHNTKEFKGTGIGLAMCKKLLNNILVKLIYSQQKEQAVLFILRFQKCYNFFHIISQTT